MSYGDIATLITLVLVIAAFFHGRKRGRERSNQSHAAAFAAGYNQHAVEVNHQVTQIVSVQQGQGATPSPELEALRRLAQPVGLREISARRVHELAQRHEWASQIERPGEIAASTREDLHARFLESEQ